MMNLFSKFANLMADYFDETVDNYSMRRNIIHTRFIQEGKWECHGVQEKWERICDEIQTFLKNEIRDYLHKEDFNNYDEGIGRTEYTITFAIEDMEVYGSEEFFAVTFSKVPDKIVGNGLIIQVSCSYQS